MVHGRVSRQGREGIWAGAIVATIGKQA